MRGNSHVQFLGGWARATAPGYPATLPAKLLDAMLRRVDDSILKDSLLMCEWLPSQKEKATTRPYHLTNNAAVTR